MGIKIHYVHAREPLTDYTGLKVACGRELAHAVAAYIIDYDLCDIAYTMTGVCQGCRKVDDRKRYLYGVVEGQEAKLEVEQEIRIGEA